MADLEEMNKTRHILITGASSGLGKALAYSYATPETVLFLGGRNQKRLEETASLCRKKGALVHSKALDVTDKNSMQRWIIDADTKSPLDLVIANAGVSGGTGDGKSGENSNQAQHIFDVNVMGVLNTVNPVLPRMRERDKGQIAIMSSLVSFCGWPGAPSYSASKGAVRFYGEALHGSLMSTGVKISVICPGFIETPMTAVNNYPMPFVMTADKAADLIIRQLQKNKARIAFPFPVYWCAGFLGILPPSISLRLLHKLPAKPENKSTID